MAISVSKKKAKINKRVEPKELSFLFSSFLAKLFFRIPTIVLILILIFLWSSSTTIISGKVVHICVSSRKLNNLYCISAGTEPNLDTPSSLLNGTSPSILVDTKHTPSNVVDVLLKESSRLGIPTPMVNESSTSTNNVVDDLLKESSRLDIPTPIVNGSSTSTDNVVDVLIQKSSSLDIPISRVNESSTFTPSEKQESTSVSVNSIAGNQILAFRNNMVKSGDEELEMAYNDVEDQLQVHRSWAATSKNHTTCDGRGIYVYELPTKFNKDLVAQCADMIPWVNLCKYFSNDAMGESIQKLGKGWYQTHQYSLEQIFHSRVMNHPCRVYSADEAKLFYVPFYGGLDILRWHFKNVSNDVKDTLGLDLVRWLESQKHWFQKSGNDHVFVLGKISWDFRRSSDTKWGSRFLELDEMQNPVKLLIERQPWHVNDIGIPHPTYFHPQSDDDIIMWQLKIIKSNRKSLVSFAGAARPGAPENIRSMLINQCTSTKDEECKFLNCNSGKCDQPESIIELFMESEFCLQPPGDSPTRKSVFDSLISGCIPVIFDPFTAYYQYSWHLPEDHRKYSVFIDQEDVRNMKVNVVERLMQIPAKERENMRRYIIYELLPGLVYGDPKSKMEKFQDAFSITINNLFERLNKLEL
ncbi:PREDICTED: xyloglucan-specific galacturonosyltransferase 1-like [Nicotiana attenuata]|uniref:xyloglucan-specific galacturonosyltransferase 1-like n=1 Tax=Nicotiana attenuata TaxID=49451 RepID=UPI000904BA86|nr:PREDICTED: xyloglucan-specific galacturonosyltransferase 1-like [Nicotiana attenuata]